jgi:predicted molibdopterin-dependent oxidoreductase YjgC
VVKVAIDGVVQEARPNEFLIDLINRAGASVPQVCYHPELGPVQTFVSGNYMRPGTGAYPLRGHNNVQGASDHGAMPNMQPGYQPVDDAEVRQRFETGWKVKRLPPRDWTITRWWKRFMRASLKRCI